MTPAAAPVADDPPVGPHPSYIEVAKPYIFDQNIQKCLANIGMSEAKEDAVRLQGVAWIDNVRRAMQLPVKTFNTAVVYYHKFRLLHPDTEYNFMDAAAAALFTACKIEDTLKKSREILCASWNLKLPPAEQLSPDDIRFQEHSRIIIVLERIMLESSSFDFRNRHPQKLVVKLVKACRFPKDTVGKTAYNLSRDMYRTFAPLKQTASTMAIACVELTARLHNVDVTPIMDGEKGISYKKWSTSRAEVIETMLDLLDLYTHHRLATTIGNQLPLDTFINVRIPLNQESSAAKLPRYTEWKDDPKPSPSTHMPNGKKSKNGVLPAQTPTATPASPSQPVPSALGIRGLTGTVRFMLDAAQARKEKEEVDKYHTTEEEEYEVEVPVEPERRRAR
ncbi:cyclin-like protein [Delitschia confertaspora ATCC 74209]|uniref:RNA polymerase II holoenzyme cyclin-like subunit n=1 Tax=Delitschia confertaspora ATCC 74209 TaxID=1513339 RepID=A0A9P4MTW1_9PLEO|nr:cyclin-like protein [Delitschia confertaspora ATCC 74209]